MKKFLSILFLFFLIYCGSDENSDEIRIIESRNKPTWLPPDPLLNLGVKLRLIYERIRARSEI